ncbi:trimeric intracellular cation channel family protein [Sporosarcina saromensis]|uniref:Trimeric intracellular cation channel family protein n=1 Tax=Sporosarcina saromensis TaxID=359365 RepID=A0ABU4G5S4_9BACL|nr:trimeric intracellular cation channel family protein [Sporosarcina saromensis]MDW0111698.1 trimeric intracellular cation channel family protein [Sporosarcina saromensis]
MAWEVFSFIGTVAFAISGAFVALEEDYDIFGVYILGMVTAFGGGALRNVVIGVPVSVLWDQNFLFGVATLSILLIFYFSKSVISHWNRWGTYFDAIGLAAFAIQGAMLAVKMDLSIAAVMVAAVLTGAGGGVIRDVLAGRKPLIFKDDIYAVWAAAAGFIVAIGFYKNDLALYALLVATATLRILSFLFHWKLPHGKVTNEQ